ncbi:hypothetical protein [Nocardiopsis sp. FR4]|uniref:hypothetical protein n=1 Tax=Nocardiopsis sp. FR4 TaxID=2605985 RepID=UPI00135AC4F8|nr:hypothetical protein [Nocardiopsis sp. FR4]
MTREPAPNTLLFLLQRHYGEQWSIRRHGGLWIATATRHDVTHAPTLVEENVEIFVHQLEYPPAGIGVSGLTGERVTENGLRVGATEDGPPEG